MTQHPGLGTIVVYWQEWREAKGRRNLNHLMSPFSFQIITDINFQEPKETDMQRCDQQTDATAPSVPHEKPSGSTFIRTIQGKLLFSPL